MKQRDPEDEPLEPLEPLDTGDIVPTSDVGPVFSRWYLRYVDLKGPGKTIRDLTNGKLVIQLSDRDDELVDIKFLKCIWWTHLSKSCF